MAADARQSTVAVAETLKDRVPQFAFLQAMWLLHRAYPGAVRCGYYDFLTAERGRQEEPDLVIAAWIAE